MCGAEWAGCGGGGCADCPAAPPTACRWSAGGPAAEGGEDGAVGGADAARADAVGLQK